MPRQKKEKIIHLDIEEMAEKKAPKQTQVNTVTLGEKLETARKKKKLELEEISENIRIKTIYLEALEKGHYYVFPARSYAVGFLRNYAKYLKLNPDEMVELFYQETNNVKDEPLEMLVIEKHFSLPSFKMVASVLGIVCLIYLLWYLIAVYFYPNFFVKKEPELLQQASQLLETETLPPVVEEPVVTESVPEKPKIPEIKEVAAEAFTAPFAFVAKDRVWVSIKDTENNKVLLDKTLSKNEHYIPTIDIKYISVSTGRSGALTLYQDGKKIKAFGKEENLSLASLDED